MSLYTNKELIAAIGHDVEYIINPGVWSNYKPAGIPSKGTLLAVNAHNSGYFSSIMVRDYTTKGLVAAYATDIRRVEFLDLVRYSRLFLLATAGGV